jgi:hypothetical protein
MSKKYKRQVRKETTSAASRGPASAERQAAALTTAATASRIQSSSSTAFNPDYSYVMKDLRRIGLLAGTFISILILLAFFLR